jgi:gas vesicle protein
MRDEYEFDDDDAFVVIERQSAGIGTFLIGAAIGAGVALLFAPGSGEETRREIQRGARRVRDAAQDVASDAVGRVSDTFQEARRQVEERIDAARHAIELKKQQVTRAMDAGREAARDARGELEARLASTKAAYHAGEDVAREAHEDHAARRAARRARRAAALAPDEDLDGI